MSKSTDIISRFAEFFDEENTEKLSFRINAQFLKIYHLITQKSVKSLKKLEKAPSLKLNADVKSSKLNDEGEEI